MNQQQSVESFYDELSNQYTELIRKCVPRYDEMFFNMFHYLPNGFNPGHILDLGCGTGNLTAAALQYYPGARVHALDVSGEILEECKTRFAGIDNIHYHQQDFNNLEFEDASFDLIISSIAIHHITDAEKAALYIRLYKLLKPGGVFVFADQTSGATTGIYQKHIARWKQAAFELGSTQENWDMWMAHQTAHDHHASTAWHLDELRNAGFKFVDILWKNIMWSVVMGTKH
jgi:tRNA (cmo5U34)-methyltransferase